MSDRSHGDERGRYESKVESSSRHSHEHASAGRSKSKKSKHKKDKKHKKHKKKRKSSSHRRSRDQSPSRSPSTKGHSSDYHYYKREKRISDDDYYRSSSRRDSSRSTESRHRDRTPDQSHHRRDSYRRDTDERRRSPHWSNGKPHRSRSPARHHRHRRSRSLSPRHRSPSRGNHSNGHSRREPERQLSPNRNGQPSSPVRKSKRSPLPTTTSATKARATSAISHSNGNSNSHPSKSNPKPFALNLLTNPPRAKNTTTGQSAVKQARPQKKAFPTLKQKSKYPKGKPSVAPTRIFPPGQGSTGTFKAPLKRKPLCGPSRPHNKMAASTVSTASSTPEPPPKTALQKLLDGEMDELSLEETKTEAEITDHSEGACIECEERAATRICDQCQDEYCDACFASLHRRGKRKEHTYTAKEPVVLRKVDEAPAAEGKVRRPSSSSGAKETTLDNLALLKLERNSPEWFVERAKHIPVRLKLKERKFLRMLEGALLVSTYTDKVDRTDFKSESKRIHAIVTQLCALFTGMVLAFDHNAGCEVAASRNFTDVRPLLAYMLEVGRRHKIMNPERMRTQYGKLVFLLQDALSPQIQELLDVDVRRDIVTVHAWLAKHGIEDVLRHPLLATATMEILPEGKSRPQIQREIKAKETAQEKIARQFVYSANRNISKDDIKWCLYSMSDNNSFLRVNRFPVDYMILLLKHFFDPKEAKPGYDLSIAAGKGNARLTHSHEHQYHYVLQTLTLWSKILDDFFRLWHLAEQDLLDSSYKLTDTGQGHHRQQQAPRIYAAMRAILQQTQQELGTWIGSSVIHLGDNNVPNALVFIDKYTQVARILGPIVQTLKALPKLNKTPRINKWFDSAFGGLDELIQTICHDFFSKGFDGSGADNFYDAGSCIDGRLTSAWNWCQQLPNKPFYPVFSLAGFTSFDGEFQD
eukprot:TRINITY_DN7102_c0_g1_i2.p1 TRINITY_DN7102_c0_g1~~TRINITY_DN7102_c0_g1_i2.p1  ORF type:complete len:925 (+),score=196.84 TRINITY_DN7102_c0_g1_i2:56-2830(+)